MIKSFLSGFAKTKRFLVVAAVLAGVVSTPASATQYFDVRITGNLLGTTSTVQCSSGSGPACLANYPGGSSTDALTRSFTLALGAMDLVEGNNPFTYGAAFGPGLYSGTIVNTAGILTGRDLSFSYADASCRTGAVGCRTMVASTASFSVIQAAVPEPATWAMMLIGFGAIGVQLRRRRPVYALQAA